MVHILCTLCTRQPLPIYRKEWTLPKHAAKNKNSKLKNWTATNSTNQKSCLFFSDKCELTAGSFDGMVPDRNEFSIWATNSSLTARPFFFFSRENIFDVSRKRRRSIPLCQERKPCTRCVLLLVRTKTFDEMNRWQNPRQAVGTPSERAKSKFVDENVNTSSKKIFKRVCLLAEIWCKKYLEAYIL